VSTTQTVTSEARAEREVAAAGEGDAGSDSLRAAAVRAEPVFTSHWQRLERLSTVRPGTVALLTGARGARIRRPGELLVPGWPFGPEVMALVVNLEPATLHVRVDHLATLDHEDLDWVELEVQVRVNEASVLGLASAPGSDVNTQLVLEARSVIEASVRAAVGLNRAEDLRRQSLTAVLDSRWMPTSFVQGALIRVGFTVRKIAWTGDSEEPPRAAPPRDGDADDPAPLRLSSLTARWPDAERSTADALQFVYLPAVISVSVFWLFFTCFWLPEIGRLPGAHLVLEQLAPLASKELTSHAQPLVAPQAEQSGLVAAFLLVVSLLLPPLARARHWLARVALWPLTYLAAIGAAVSFIGAAVRGHLAEGFLGLLLLFVWVAAAVVTTWRSLWVDVDALPRRPGRTVWLVVAFALFTPAPIALGRMLFAPGLRDAALLVLHNDFSLRWAALLMPETLLLYLCGLLLAGLAWVVYELWPPRPVPSVRLPLTVLALAILGLAVLGPEATHGAQQREEVIRTQSPPKQLGLNCGRWTFESPGQPVKTVRVTGFTCRRVTAFTGYQEVASWDMPASLSPVTAETLAGQRAGGGALGAQFGDVLVLAGTNRSDDHATVVTGISMVDGGQLWQFSCLTSEKMSLRYAGSAAGDDPALGRLTLPGEQPGVVVDCGAGPLHFDPRTGRQV
jgi:hypothetical protein